MPDALSDLRAAIQQARINYQERLYRTTGTASPVYLQAKRKAAERQATIDTGLPLSNPFTQLRVRTYMGEVNDPAKVLSSTEYDPVSFLGALGGNIDPDTPSVKLRDGSGRLVSLREASSAIGQQLGLRDSEFPSLLNRKSALVRGLGLQWKSLPESAAWTAQATGQQLEALLGEAGYGRNAGGFDQALGGIIRRSGGLSMAEDNPGQTYLRSLATAVSPTEIGSILFADPRAHEERTAGENVARFAGDVGGFVLTGGAAAAVRGGAGAGAALFERGVTGGLAKAALENVTRGGLSRATAAIVNDSLASGGIRGGAARLLGIGARQVAEEAPSLLSRAGQIGGRVLAYDVGTQAPQVAVDAIDIARSKGISIGEGIQESTKRTVETFLGLAANAFRFDKDVPIDQRIMGGALLLGAALSTLEAGGAIKAAGRKAAVRRTFGDLNGGFLTDRQVRFLYDTAQQIKRESPETARALIEDVKTYYGGAEGRLDLARRGAEPLGAEVEVRPELPGDQVAGVTKDKKKIVVTPAAEESGRADYHIRHEFEHILEDQVPWDKLTEEQQLALRAEVYRRALNDHRDIENPREAAEYYSGLFREKDGSFTEMPDAGGEWKRYVIDEFFQRRDQGALRKLQNATNPEWKAALKIVEESGVNRRAYLNTGFDELRQTGAAKEGPGFGSHEVEFRGKKTYLDTPTKTKWDALDTEYEEAVAKGARPATAGAARARAREKLIAEATAADVAAGSREFLIHYSQHEGITELDPERYGESGAMTGAEAARKASKAFVKTTFLGSKYRYREPNIEGRPNVYETMTPYELRKFYDAQGDPDGIVDRLMREGDLRRGEPKERSWGTEYAYEHPNAFGQLLDSGKFQAEIIKKGYIGWTVGDPDNASAYQMFKTTPVRPTSKRAIAYAQASRDNIQKGVEAALQGPDSGFTFSPDKAYGSNTDGGYAVGGVVPTRSVDPSMLDVAQIEDFAREHAAVLSRPGMKLGLWNNPETGKVDIDVTELIPDRAKAEEVGRGRGEQAIGFLADGGKYQGTIPLDRDGIIASREFARTGEPSGDLSSLTDDQVRRFRAEGEWAYSRLERVLRSPKFRDSFKDIVKELPAQEERVIKNGKGEIVKVIPAREATSIVEPGATAANQVIQALKAHGVADEELHWSGLADLLDEKNPGYTREGMLERLTEKYIELGQESYRSSVSPGEGDLGYDWDTEASNQLDDYYRYQNKEFRRENEGDIVFDKDGWPLYVPFGELSETLTPVMQQRIQEIIDTDFQSVIDFDAPEQEGKSALAGFKAEIVADNTEPTVWLTDAEGNEWRMTLQGKELGEKGFSYYSPQDHGGYTQRGQYIAGLSDAARERGMAAMEAIAKDDYLQELADSWHDPHNYDEHGFVEGLWETADDADDLGPFREAYPDLSRTTYNELETYIRAQNGIEYGDWPYSWIDDQINSLRDSIEEHSVDSFSGDTSWQEYRMLRFPDETDYREIVLTAPSLAKRTSGSHHWGSSNDIAHARFDGDVAAVDNEGQPVRVTVIHELQSDWHQAGRQHGYVKDMPSDVAARLASLGAQLRERWEWALGNLPYYLQKYGWVNDPDAAFRYAQNLVNEAKNTTPQQFRSGYRNNSRPITELALRSLARVERKAEEIAALTNEIEVLGEPYKGSVPDAPFKSSWPGVMLRRVIEQAVQDGDDAVVWVTPEIVRRKWSHAPADHYSSKVPEAAERFAKDYGREVEEFTVTAAEEGRDFTDYQLQGIRITQEMRQDVASFGVPLFGSKEFRPRSEGRSRVRGALRDILGSFGLRGSKPRVTPAERPAQAEPVNEAPVGTPDGSVAADLPEGMSRKPRSASQLAEWAADETRGEQSRSRDIEERGLGDVTLDNATYRSWADAQRVAESRNELDDIASELGAKVKTGEGHTDVEVAQTMQRLADIEARMQAIEDAAPTQNGKLVLGDEWDRLQDEKAALSMDYIDVGSNTARGLVARRMFASAFDGDESRLLRRMQSTARGRKLTEAEVRKAGQAAGDVRKVKAQIESEAKAADQRAHRELLAAQKKFAGRKVSLKDLEGC